MSKFVFYNKLGRIHNPHCINQAIKRIIENHNIETIIGMPSNLFFGTGIPVCVLVLKRERNGNSDNILFIDASNDFEAGKNQEEIY